jgi:hypothetical protein
MVDWLLNGAIHWLAAIILTVITALWGLLSQTAFSTPDVTVLPQVTEITGRSLTVVNVGFILAVVTAGIVVMTKETVQVRYGVSELAPRLVIGFVAANFASLICQQLVVVANALTQALTGDGVSSTGAFGQLLRVIQDSMNNPANDFLVVVIGLLIAALTGMLLVTWLVRLGVLVVLVGVSPVALACHATPFTEGAARLWWRSMLATLATVVLQALALQTTLKIFLNPNVNVPALGLPNDPTGTFNLFIVACLLWVTIKIPSLMRRYVTRSGGQHNVAGLILRMVGVQQLTSILRLPLPGRGGRAAAAAGGARRGGAVGGGTGGQPSAASTVIAYWRPRMPRPTPNTRPAPSTGRPTPIGGGGTGTSGSGQPSSGRPVVPAGVNPATAMPKTRPAWQTGGARAASGQQPAPAASPRVPAGVTPATAMPRTRPAWQTPLARPQPAPPVPPPAQPSPQSPARGQVPRGVNPGNATPRRRPNWRR